MKHENNVHEFLNNFFAVMARQRIEKMIRGQKISKERGQIVVSDKGLGEYISIIMLWSSVGSVFLKLHFNIDVAKKLAAGSLAVNSDEVSKEMALDFMKECSNGVGGFIRSLFESNQVLMGMSLPFLAEGRDEVIFKKILDNRAQVAQWNLVLEDGSQMVFTSELCLLEPETIWRKSTALEKAMEEGETEQSASGEVEFLF